jgi:hypothetical protein
MSHLSGSSRTYLQPLTYGLKPVPFKNQSFSAAGQAESKAHEGMNGRYNSAPDGDRFRDLTTRRQPAGFTEKGYPGIERV